MSNRPRERVGLIDSLSTGGRADAGGEHSDFNVPGMEYFPPQLRVFNSPVLPRLKRSFYFGTVV